MISHCSLCSSSSFSKIFTVKNVPVFPFIKFKKEAYLGNVEIVKCNNCGHIFNYSFEDRLIGKLYTSDFITNSPVSKHMTKSIEKLKDYLFKKNIPKNILEIGGGSGALAIAFFSHVKNYVMVEPSNKNNCQYLKKIGINAINDIFPSKKIPDIKFDLIISRQVLEHIQDPKYFLKSLKKYCHKNTLLYIEVPSAEYILENNSLIDFHYPHVQYYQKEQIQYLFNLEGFEIKEVQDIKKGHDIGFILKVKENIETNIPKVKEFKIKRSTKDLVQQIKNKQVALYGANAYSQSFLGLYGNDIKIKYVFDDTKEYKNLFVYQDLENLIPILIPDKNNISKVDLIIITAYLHDETISKKLHKLGYNGRVLTVRTDKHKSKLEKFFTF